MPDRRVALITGCSTGVGLHTAVGLAGAGYRIVATMRDPRRGDELASVAAAAGVAPEVRRLDVADAASIEDCVAGVMADHGRIDVLVNNAGAGLAATLEQTSDSDLRRIMDVNFFGSWNATKAVVPHMRAAGQGRIVSVTSLGGMVGQPFNDAYCAAKFAVEGFMESFAPVAKTMGIHLSVVAPGPINTAFVSNLETVSAQAVAAMTPPYDAMFARYAALAEKSFAGLGQTGEEVARIIVDLCLAEDPAFSVTTAPLVDAAFAAKVGDPTGRTVIDNFAAALGMQAAGQPDPDGHISGS